MSQNTNTLTYKQNMSKSELFRIIKAIGIPMLVFGLGIFTISNFATFGAKLICPLAGAMWAIGFIVALLMPSHLFSCSAWVKNLISCCIRRQF